MSKVKPERHKVTVGRIPRESRAEKSRVETATLMAKMFQVVNLYWSDVGKRHEAPGLHKFGPEETPISSLRESRFVEQ